MNTSHPPLTLNAAIIIIQINLNVKREEEKE